jgi:alpha-galactosidase
MGWNSWNALQTRVDDKTIRAMADAMLARGMKDAGYEYIVLDDGWKAQSRDSAGRLMADATKFPSGIKALADYIHGKGLKFGIYTDAGSADCVSDEPGSKDHEDLDARTFAEWGVDYVKVDWCHTEGQDAPSAYAKVSRAIQATGRPMVLSVCEWGDHRPWRWAPSLGNLWRTTGDGKDCWACGRETAGQPGGYPRGWTLILDAQVGLEKHSGPGHWNDPDLLLVGLPGLTVEEARAQFSLWAMLAAPLIASCDLVSMSPAIGAILNNKEVIAVDQDALGRQGIRVSLAGEHEVWVRQLADGSRAVVLFNRSRERAVMSVSAKEAGLEDNGALQVRDLWGGTELTRMEGRYAMGVPPHGVAMLRIAAVAGH